MKKAMFCCLFLLAFYYIASASPERGGSVYASTHKGTPPQAVLKAFEQKFPGMTDVDWSKEKNGEWEAEFDQGEAEMSANFSASGQWLETETEIKASELPAPVLAALQGKKIKEAAKITRADGSTVYEAEVRGKDWLFDAQGNKM